MIDGLGMKLQTPTILTIFNFLQIIPVCFVFSSTNNLFTGSVAIPLHNYVVVNTECSMVWEGAENTRYNIMGNSAQTLCCMLNTLREVIIKKKMKVWILSKLFVDPSLPPKVWIQK